MQSIPRPRPEKPKRRNLRSIKQQRDNRNLDKPVSDTELDKASSHNRTTENRVRFTDTRYKSDLIISDINNALNGYQIVAYKSDLNVSSINENSRQGSGYFKTFQSGRKRHSQPELTGNRHNTNVTLNSASEFNKADAKQTTIDNSGVNSTHLASSQTVLTGGNKQTDDNHVICSNTVRQNSAIYSDKNNTRDNSGEDLDKLERKLRVNAVVRQYSLKTSDVPGEMGGGGPARLVNGGKLSVAPDKPVRKSKLIIDQREMRGRVF